MIHDCAITSAFEPSLSEQKSLKMSKSFSSPPGVVILAAVPPALEDILSVPAQEFLATLSR